MIKNLIRLSDFMESDRVKYFNRKSSDSVEKSKKLFEIFKDVAITGKDLSHICYDRFAQAIYPDKNQTIDSITLSLQRGGRISAETRDWGLVISDSNNSGYYLQIHYWPRP